MFGPSVSRPTMPSAEFCTAIPTPLDVSSTWQLCRSPRVSRTHLHAYAAQQVPLGDACRIYAALFRASTGLWPFSMPHPSASPRIRFLFVRPALCLGLPSDSQSPAKPLPLANTSPCRVCRGLAPPSECALPGARKKRGIPKRIPRVYCAIQPVGISPGPTSADEPFPTGYASP